MAVVIRLARFGKHKKPFYRVVAAEKGTRREGRFLEVVGTYNPLLKSGSTVTFKEDRLNKWLSVGALPTEQVRSLIKVAIPGVIETLEDRRKEKVRQARAKRKERLRKLAA
jgi:small subunit ribosomal protein S16